MRFKKTILILFCSALIFSACKKDIGLKPGPIASDPYVCPFEQTDTAQNYSQLPPEPFGGYFEATEYGKKSVWRVVPDPVNENIIYYLTSEQGQPQHTLWRYNLVTKIKQPLTNKVLNNLDIHNNEWIIFDTFDWNIYKIKTNGDSLTQLTFDGASKFPSWSENGQYIYFVSDLGGVRKITDSGDSVTTYNLFSWVREKNNKIYFAGWAGTSVCLFEKDLTTQTDRMVVNGATFDSTESLNDFFIVTDKNQCYWWGSHGLSITNINTLKTERLFSNTLSSRCWFAHFRQSPVTKRFFAVMFTVFAVNSNTIKQTGEVFEFSEDGKCRRKINIPN